MINKNSQAELEKILGLFVNNYEINKNSREVLVRLKERVKAGKLSDIFSKNLPVEMLKNNEKYWLAKELSILLEKLIKKYGDKLKTNLKPEAIIPENFFTKIEIKQFEEEPVLSEEIRDENVLVLHDVVETVEGKQWICGKSSIRDIVDYFYVGLVNYNLQMQRESEKITLFGETYERAKTYKKSIKEIASDMLNGVYTPTAISFNILANGTERYDYDKDTLTLTIVKEEGSEFSIVDGYHRVSGGMMALEVNPQLIQPMQINVFHMNIEEARKYIAQEGKKNAINPVLLKFYDSSNVYNLIAKDLGESGSPLTNKLFGNVGKEMLDVEKMNKYCIYETLCDSIEHNFNFDQTDMRERRRLKDYLIKFFNELISIFKNEFANVKKSRETSFVTYNNMFYFYMSLAKEYQHADDNDDNWEDKLFDLLAKIDFSQTGELWKELNIDKDKISKQQIKKIEEYSKNFVG